MTAGNPIAAKKRRDLWVYWERYGIFILFLLALIVSAVLKPQALTPDNLLNNVLARATIVGTAACGMTFAICSGGFDLSVGAILGLSTCVFAANLPNMGLLPATLLTLLVGAVA
ncbi:MAG: hypothetical protein FWG03_10860, partial [Clostridiales bacterium]|nr:hypothetical protein [Clostridiales bacterium]